MSHSPVKLILVSHIRSVFPRAHENRIWKATWEWKLLACEGNTKKQQPQTHGRLISCSWARARRMTCLHSGRPIVTLEARRVRRCRCRSVVVAVFLVGVNGRALPLSLSRGDCVVVKDFETVFLLFFFIRLRWNNKIVWADEDGFFFNRAKESNCVVCGCNIGRK